jgi:hypothetical protein
MVSNGAANFLTERRGVGKVPNIHNMSMTTAIHDLFSVNFAVVFDFMYFRFCPSKAKSIGNVLTNRQNAANCCLHRGFKKTAEEFILFRGFFFCSPCIA